MTPIGKFLFATESQVQRNKDMSIELVTTTQISEFQLQQYLNQNYQANQELWQRASQLNYRNERLNFKKIYNYSKKWLPTGSHFCIMSADHKAKKLYCRVLHH